MSHQTGIKANDKLSKVFVKSRNGKLRVIKISIENEELTCASTADVKKDWEKDYDKLLVPMLDKDIPCYILYRFDSKISLGYGWLLLSWIPDTATIRQKMVYASTKATLKTEFSSAYIIEEFHATTLDEATFEGYLRNKRAFAAPAPLTTREEELVELKKTEINTEINVETRQQILGGIDCPLSEDTKEAVKDIVRGRLDYLQFRIDLEEERIYVTEAAAVPLEELPKHIPEDQPRYHLYVFKHTHEGDYQESCIFIYSMPGVSCKVRERMMYSTSKAQFLEALKDLGVEVVKKLEIGSGSELSEEYLQEELHPKKMLHRPAFAKPKGPPNRGAKRMTRPQEPM